MRRRTPAASTATSAAPAPAAPRVEPKGRKPPSLLGRACSALVKFVVFVVVLLAAGALVVHFGGHHDKVAPVKDALHQKFNEFKARKLPSEEGGGAAKEAPAVTSESEGGASHEGLVIHTKLGDVRIHFLPEVAGQASIDYIAAVVASSEKGACEQCHFYRIEQNVLLQGILAAPTVPKNEVLGPCPIPGYKPTRTCPPEDSSCGCHGPEIERGMVAWAVGGGPDFMINTAPEHVGEWWKHEHTVWGEIRDEESFKVVEGVYQLPIDVQKTIKTGRKTLEEEIGFTLELF